MHSLLINPLYKLAKMSHFICLLTYLEKLSLALKTFKASRAEREETSVLSLLPMLLQNAIKNADRRHLFSVREAKRHKQGFKRLFVLFGVLFVTAYAYAETFAAFTVTPAGDQTYDIATGITTLPEGGDVVVAESELTLHGAYIRYHNGKFVETSDTLVKGRFGTFEADNLYLDLASSELSASGNLNLKLDQLEIVAEEISLYLKDNIAVLKGGVRSTQPDFLTSVLVIDLTKNDAILVSPYEYKDGPISLKQQVEGELLQLSQGKTDTDLIVYNAITEIQPVLLETLSPYLP